MTTLLQSIAEKRRAELIESPNPGNALHLQSFAYSEKGEFDNAIRLGKESFRLAVKGKIPYWQGAANFYTGLAYFFKGKDYWERSAEHLKDSARQFHTSNDLHAEGTAHYARGIVLELLSRKYVNRWHDALESYLEAYWAFDRGGDALLTGADGRYRAATRIFARRKNQRYPTPSVPPAAPAALPIAPAPPPPGPAPIPKKPADGDSALFQLPRYFGAMVAVCIFLGLAVCILILLEHSLLLAFAMGFGVLFFGSLLVLTLVYSFAGQLYCEVPEDCQVVFQYRRGELSVRGEGGHTIWAFPLLEWMRAVVPMEPLSFSITNLELSTPSAHVVANAKGTYKVERPILLVRDFADDTWRSILGIPRRLDRERTAKKVESLLGNWLKEAIGSAANGKTPVEILLKTTPIKIRTRNSLRDAASIRGIFVFKDLELELHVRELPTW